MSPVGRVSAERVTRQTSPADGAGGLRSANPPYAAAGSANGNGPSSGRGAGDSPPGSQPPAPGDTIFKHAAQIRACGRLAERESQARPKRQWLMSQSPLHKQFFISDLEWPVAQATQFNKLMTPILLQQFRIYYAQDRPVGVLLWGFVNDEVEGRLTAGTTKLRPQDWKSGDKLWVVEAIAPFGGPEEMIKDLKAKVFPAREIRYVAMTKEGQKEVRVG